MQLFSQRDPRWANIHLATQSGTMAQIGCVVTSIAMLTTYFKPDHTPFDLLKTLRFTPDGRIQWDSCRFEQFRFDFRGYERNDDAIKFYINDPDRAVILQVANNTHWVVATGQNLFSRLYKIADPWFGDRADMGRYKNQITGAAYFIRR